jgi:hypothetical protein
MNKWFALSLTVITASSLSGCAWYSIKPIAPVAAAGWKGSADGYVFYQPELYFLVTPPGASKGGSTNAPAGAGGEADKGSGWTVTPVYLPNPKKPYEVTTHNFLAKSDFAFNFKDGWQLTSISDKADNTTVANTIAGELKTILAAGGLGIASVPKSDKQTFLLQPTYDNDGKINGFDPIDLTIKKP